MKRIATALAVLGLLAPATAQAQTTPQMTPLICHQYLTGDWMSDDDIGDRGRAIRATGFSWTQHWSRISRTRVEVLGVFYHRGGGQTAVWGWCGGVLKVKDGLY